MEFPVTRAHCGDLVLLGTAAAARSVIETVLIGNSGRGACVPCAVVPVMTQMLVAVLI